MSRIIQWVISKVSNPVVRAKVIDWIKRNWWWLSGLAWGALQAAVDYIIRLFGG